jgi:hypothetical protein
MSIDWILLRSQLDADLDKNSAILSKILKDVIPKALKAEAIDAEIGDTTNRLISEVAYRTHADIQKLRFYQEDDVDPYKMISYLCFWIRKLKPVPVYPKNGKAMLDINERLSLWLMAALVSRFAEIGVISDAVEAKRITQNARRFFENEQLFKYTVHALRYRTFGPHHYTVIMRLICS